MMTASSMLVKPAARNARPYKAFVSQVAREYRDKLAERLLRRELRKPWMKYREICILEDLLANLRPNRVLEWGAGYGSFHFARLLHPDAEWIAIEHDARWAQRIQSLKGDPRVRVHSVPPDNSEWRANHHDGTYEDFRNYVDYPENFGPYDFILVDGRAREACLEKTWSLLTPDGVVVLHDANRAFRRAPSGRFPHEAEFRDYRNWSGGMWIGSKGRPLTSLLDLGGHGRIWRIYNSLGKGFHL